MVSVTNEQTTMPIDVKSLETKAQKLISFLGYTDFDLGILLTDQKKMHEFNKKYRSKDSPTDILSFPYHDNLQTGKKIIPASEDDKNLGDIILCPEYIKQDLARWGQSLEKRMDILLVHGVLHLLGYDHIEDEDYEVMKKEEQRLLDYLKGV